VIGGFAELFAAAGREAPANLYDREQFDPHRPGIDEFSWSCPECKEGAMRRVPEVIDAWFDSGAMPFAQHHYRGEALPQFDPKSGNGFPADLISEAVDQTRGWFYTLHALGVLLFDQPAYKHCIVLGHINDEQGRKMSKRLGNVVEPMAVIAETGADALRWYFCINNPEVPSRFSARLVREAAQKFLLPLWNALSFFTIYANLDGWRPGAAVPPFSKRPALDRWILLRLEEEVRALAESLDRYQVTPAAQRLEAFLDDLTNWYIRRSRDRFWGSWEEGGSAKESAYQTLYRVLTTLARLIAPFTPFVAEELHQHLVRSQDPAAPESVHLESWPEHHEELFAGEALQIFAGMNLILRLARLGRAARNTHNLKTRQPLAAVTLVSRNPGDAAPHVERFADLLKDELNVQEIRWAERRSDFVHCEVKPIFPKLGKRLGKQMPRLKDLLAAADGDALAEELERSGQITVDLDGQPVTLDREEVEVRLIEKEGLATAGDSELLVALDIQLTPELIAEGRAREIVHHVQAARKDKDLDYADRIRLRYRAAPELAEAIAAHREWIAGETLVAEWIEDAGTLTETTVDGLAFGFDIERI
jgi:isoleucyl-tRNA synthetase